MALGQNIPLFFRLYHKLKQDIIRGEIPRGAKIDTIGEMALQHGVSQSSVRKSLDLLEREGLLHRKQGWGTVVPENLELYFFDLGRLVSSKKTFLEMNRADIRIAYADWVQLTPRIRNVLNSDAPITDSSVYKIDSRIFFPGKWEFKALVTFFFTERWLRENKADGSTPPREILLRMSHWLSVASPLKMKEALLPFLCTDESAEFLGLPDGTPVFHSTVAIKEEINRCCFCWEMISNANIFYRELR